MYLRRKFQLFRLSCFHCSCSFQFRSGRGEPDISKEKDVPEQVKIFSKKKIGTEKREGKQCTDQRHKSETQIHKDNVGSDLFNVFKADTEIASLFEKVAEHIFIADDNLADTAGAFIKFQISHMPQLFAVLDVDDFFAGKIT